MAAFFFFFQTSGHNGTVAKTNKSNTGSCSGFHRKIQYTGCYYGDSQCLKYSVSGSAGSSTFASHQDRGDNLDLV